MSELEDWISGINKAIENGADSISSIGRKIGLTHKMVSYYAKRDGIKLPKGKAGRPKGTKRKPEIDLLIEKGWTLKDIGYKARCTHQAIGQYIKATGQYDFYRQKREEVKESLGIGKKGRKKIDNLQEGFLFVVRTRAEELAGKEDWATQKAVEYFHSYKIWQKDHYSFDRVYKIFSRYEDTVRSGKKLSLEELGEGLNIWPYGVGRILERVGVQPMYGKNIEKIKKREKTEAVNRGLETIFSNPDIAYFLRLPEGVPANRYSCRKIKRGKNMPISIIYSGESREYLHHSLVSQIYEAQDCGFKRKEISELTDASKKLVDYALSRRKEIEPIIADGLKILYADRDINAPYVTPEMREKLEKEEMKRRKR